MKLNIKHFFKILRKAFKGWNDDKATTLSAALAYYTVFSIAPLVLLSVAISGIFYGAEASRGEIFHQINLLIGSDAAKAIQSIVEASSIKLTGVIATLAGIVALLIGATSVFAQLQDTLNQIWKVKSKPGHGIKALLRQRLLSFSLILIIGFLLLVSLVASAFLSAAGIFATTHLPGGHILWEIVNFLISFFVTSFLFAAIYKILPDVKLSWENVRIGGITTALLFTMGKSAIGFYLGHSGVTSPFGAAGSLIVILLWTFYSSAILILGAEYTRYHSLDLSAVPKLKTGAIWLTSHELKA